MRTHAFTFDALDYRCMRQLFHNPAYPESERWYHLAWYFDYRAQGKAPYEARNAVLETLEERQKGEEGEERR